MTRFARNAPLLGLLGLFVLAGCTTRYYRKSADKAAYRAIEVKTPLVENMDPHFTIEHTNLVSLDALPVSTNAAEFLGTDASQEIGARILTLEEALSMGVRFSRLYQSSKEQLYLSALSLTLVRHQFTPIFSAATDASYSVRAVEQLVTDTNGVVISDKLVEDRSAGGSGSIAVSWLIRDLGRVTAAFTADFFRFFTGDPRTVSSSQLGATFLSPLLRDAGFKAQTEALTQAERNLLYDLRDFTLFRKDFSVRIATSYYGVLGNRDAARNSFLNLQSSRKNAAQTRALAEEGRRTQSDLGRLDQQVLDAESRWISDIRSYKRSLDDLKILLGLTVDASVMLDDHELEALQIRHPDVNVNDSIQIALAGRLDYQTTKDRRDDADRQLELTENFLKPRLDLTASGSFSSDPSKSGRFTFPDPQRYQWNTGLIFDPDLDRTPERNSYRQALIDRDRAGRDIEQREDEIKLQVREGWRTLDQARRTYEISRIGVDLAERRVEEQNLLAELGRARAQDQVDAQNALTSSKNQLTQALVTHTIARLQFWNNMGILYIKDNGQWEEMQDAKAQ